MKLSIVIVNYNVKYFLEECLLSVKNAIADISAEVFVVDNASSDGSVQMVQEKFPWVKLVANSENSGFSRANNQALKMASGEFALLLNPDTAVAEDTFKKCIDFMSAHPDCGALGVHMVDGKGNFLPESKRGLPTPSVAFYKTFGLSALFPRSKAFGKYHLGYLPENETNAVDILSGAFMLMRKEAMDKVGLLDETFFMYGEDVDLSYRFIKAGYKNYYFADTTIIHYKGESTKKGSLNYVKVFYNAMIIFARKHFSGNQSGLYSLLINMAIVFRGLLTLLANVFASSYLFIIDALLSFAGIYAITDYWEKMIKYKEHYYPLQFMLIIVPIYILFWIASTFLAGGYDKPFRISRILRGVVLGTIVIAAIYAFLPNEWRFSRAIILLGAAWTALEMLITRSLYHLIKYQTPAPETESKRHTLIVGSPAECQRAETLLRANGYYYEVLISQQVEAIEKTVAINAANEIIFCAADMPYKTIIEKIGVCGNKLDYKILNAGTNAFIGSNSKDTAGDIYLAEKSVELLKPENRRSKRVMDIAFAVLFLALLPITLALVKNIGRFIQNWAVVVWGKKSWVGISSTTLAERFPHAKQGILSPADNFKNLELSALEVEQCELNYARHYSVYDDVTLILKNFRKLGS